MDADSTCPKMEKRISEMDFLRITAADINGQPRGKLIPSHAIPTFLKGMSIYSATLLFGPVSEIPMETIQDIVKSGHPNSVFIPDIKTFHELPWSGCGKYRIGEVFATNHDEKTLAPDTTCSRHLALEQMSKLNAMGYDILSGWEMEFDLFKRDTKQPVYEGLRFHAPSTLMKLEHLVLDFERNLHKAGVLIGTIHTEFHPGQIEMTTTPILGIKAADDAFLMRNSLREMAFLKGYEANFMSKVSDAGATSGLHYNHSLVSKGTNQNVIFDATSQVSVSEVALHWVGGLLAHGGALSALCSPTVNCYRRFHQAWVPDKFTWGIHDRNAAIRVKNNGESASYIENRLPSAMANPYLVVAATIAAGIDGIVHKITPPSRGELDKCPEVPSAFEDALAALEEDAVMKKSLGEAFINRYISQKKEIDLLKFGHHDMKELKAEEIAAEMAEYNAPL